MNSKEISGKINPISAQDLHKYIFILGGVFSLFAMTYFLALIRVGQEEKFSGFHLKSWALDGKNNHNYAQKIITINKQETNLNKAKIEHKAEITDPEQLAVLNQKLYNQIAQNWQTRTFDQRLVYQVSVSANGAIIDCEPINQSASDYLHATPMPKLVKYQDSHHDLRKAESLSQTPWGKFEVIFTRQGILEVTPWQGWKK